MISHVSWLSLRFFYKPRPAIELGVAATGVEPILLGLWDPLDADLPAAY